jgi:hypothetical protein
MPVSPIDVNFAETFGGIDRIEGVFVNPIGDVLGVFTVIDEDDEETYDRIYDIERLLIRRFDGIHFDFNVIARRGRSVADIVGSSTPVWRRSGAGEPCLNVTSI